MPIHCTHSPLVLSTATMASNEQQNALRLTSVLCVVQMTFMLTIENVFSDINGSIIKGLTCKSLHMLTTFINC